MKAFVAGLVVLCFTIATVGGQSTGVTWNDDGPTDDFELFASPGVILPNLAVGDLITIAGKVWNADDLLQSIGFLCRDVGPAINQLTGGVVRELCEPVLLALRDPSQRDTFRLCNETWSLIEGLFRAEVDYETYTDSPYNPYTEGPYNPYTNGPYPTSPSLHYPPEYYDLQNFVNHLMGLGYWLDSLSSCDALGRLYHTAHYNRSENDNIFDKLITIGIYSVYSEAESRCSYGEYYDPFQNEVIGSIFRILGGYGSISDLCDNLYHSDTRLVHTVKENFYAAVKNYEECMWFLSEFQSETGLPPSNYSTFNTDSDLCNAVITAFTIGSFEYESESGQHDQAHVTQGTTGNVTNPHVDRGWLSRVIDHFGGVYTSHNDTNEALEILCFYLETTNKDFCPTIKLDYRPSFDKYCHDYYEYNPYLPNEYWSLKQLVNDLLDFEHSGEEHGVCYALEHLYYGYSNHYYYHYYHHYSNKRDAFDELLSVVIFDMILSAEGLCIHSHYSHSAYNESDAYYYYEPYGGYGGYDFNATEHLIPYSVFKLLGDYQDIDEFCDGVHFPDDSYHYYHDNYYYYYELHHKDRFIISATMKSNFYSLVTDALFCMTFMESLGTDTGLTASDFSSFASNDEFCTVLVNTFTGVDTIIVTDAEDYGGRLLNITGEIYRHGNGTRSLVKLLCFAADGTDKEFCQNLNMIGYTHFGDECTAREEYYLDYPSDYSLGTLLRSIVLGHGLYDEASCKVLGELYHLGHTNATDIFDHLLTAFIDNSAFWFFHNCYWNQHYYENFEDQIDISLMFVYDIFGFTSVEDLCNITNQAFTSPDSRDLALFLDTIKENLYDAMSQIGLCEDVIGTLQANLNISIFQSTFGDDFTGICRSGLVPLFNGNQDTTAEPSMIDTSLSYHDIYDYDWLEYLINVTAAVRRMNNTDFTVQTLCNLSPETGKRFCQSIGQQDFDGDFGYGCRHHHEPQNPEFYQIYRRVGQFILSTFHVHTFYHYYDTCSSLEHVLKIRQDEQTVPDFLLTSVFHFLVKSFVERCYYHDYPYYDDYSYEHQYSSTLAVLAGFEDINDFCTHSAMYYFDEQENIRHIVQQIKENFYLATTNLSACLDLMASFEASNLSVGLDNAGFCTDLVQAFNPDHNASMSYEETHLNGSQNILSDLRFFGKLFRLHNQVDITRYLCYASESVYNKRLCDNLERYADDFVHECWNGCPDCPTSISPSFPHPPGYYDLHSFVNNLIGLGYSLDTYSSCDALERLYNNAYFEESHLDNVFDKLLAIGIHSVYTEADSRCYYGEYYDPFQNDIIGSIFRILGGYDSTSDLCDYLYHSDSSLVDTVKENFYTAVTNVEECMWALAEFQSDTGLTPSDYSTFDTNSELCNAVIFSFNNGSLEYESEFGQHDQVNVSLATSGNFTNLYVDRKWFSRAIHHFGGVYVAGNDTNEALEILCFYLETTNKDFCSTIKLDNNPNFDGYCHEYYENYPYLPSEYWSLKPLVNDLLDFEYWGDEHGVCYALEDLYYGYSNHYYYHDYNHYSSNRDVFDELLSVFIFDIILSAEELCIHNYSVNHVYNSNVSEYWPYYSYDGFDLNATERQISYSLFRFLGEYTDMNEFCDGMHFPDESYYDYYHYHYYFYDAYHNDRFIISTIMKSNFYDTVTNVPDCMSFMESFEYDTGLGTSNFSSFATNDEFCIALVNTFTGADTHVVMDDEDYGGRLLNLTGDIYRHWSGTRSLVKLLCFAADGTDKEFCQNLNMTGYTHFGDECTAREEYYFEYPSDYSPGTLLRSIVYGHYHYDEASCNILEELYYTNATDIFDRLLTGFIDNSIFWLFHDCHYGEFGNTFDISLMFFYDNSFSLASVADICNITKRAYNSPDGSDLALLIDTIKDNLYNAMSSNTMCEEAVGALEANLNISIVESTTFNSILDICHRGLVPLFSGSHITAVQSPIMTDTPLSYHNLNDYDWLEYLINVTAAIRRMNDVDFTVQTLCSLSPETGKRFCQSIGQQDFDGDFGYGCRHHQEPQNPEFYQIYRQVGQFILSTFHVHTYYHYYDTCTSLEHILKIRQDEQTVPDFLLTSVFHFLVESVAERCYYHDYPYYDGYYYEHQYSSTLAVLAGFEDINDFCNATHTSTYYFDDQDTLRHIVQQIKENFYLATTNQTACLHHLASLQAAESSGAGDASSSLDNAEFCTDFVSAFNPDNGADISSEDTYINGSRNILSELRFFGRLFRLHNQIDITRHLCYASDWVYNKGLCDDLERYESDFIYECWYNCPSCYWNSATPYPDYPYYSNYTTASPYYSNYTMNYHYHSNHTTVSPYYPNYTSPSYYISNPLYSSEYWSLNPLVSSLVYQTWLGSYETCNAFNQIFYNYDFTTIGQDSFERLLSVFMYDSIKYATWSCFGQSSESITLTRIHPVIVRLLGKFENDDEMCNYTRHAVSAGHGAPLVFLAEWMKASLLHALTNVSACEDFFGEFTSLTTLDVNSYTSFSTVSELCDNLTQILGPSFDPKEAQMKLLHYSNKIDSLTTEEWFHSRALMVATLYSFGNDTSSVVETLCHLLPGLDNSICYNVSLNWISSYHYYYIYYSYGFNCFHGLNEDSSVIRPQANDLHICYRGDLINFNALSSFDFLGFLLELASKLYGLSTFDREGVCTSVSTVIDSGINLPDLITDFGREWLELFLPVGAEICECWDSFLYTLFPPDERFSDFGAQELRQIVDFASRTLDFQNFDGFCDDLTSSLNDDQSIRQYADRLINMSIGIMEDPDQCICLANEGLRLGLSFANISFSVFQNQYLFSYTGFRTVEELCYKLTGAIRGREVTAEEQVQSQLNQACGVCGGFTAGCFTIEPTIIPAATESELFLRGRDFEPQPGSRCNVQGESGSFDSDVVTDQMGRHYCMVNLQPGSYHVYLLSGGEVSAIYSDLYVYPDIQLDAIFPAEVDLPFSSTTMEFNLISHNGNFSSVREAGSVPQVTVINEATGRVVNAESNAISYFHEYNTSIVTVQTIAPSESGAYRIALSLNGIDPVPTPDDEGLLVRFYVGDPKPVNLRFTNKGNALRLEFDRLVSVDEDTSCDAIFENTNALGNGSSCGTRPRSNFLLVGIGKGNDLINIGDSLTLKQNDAIGVFRELYTRPQMGQTLYVQPPNMSDPVVARLDGNEVINFCSFVSIRATKTTGGAGRPMTFRWSGGPDHADLQNIFDDAGSRLNFNGSYLTPGVTYDFRCNVSNFLGGFDSVTYQVTREATVAPEVSIVAQRVNIDEPIRVSQSFGLVAKVVFSEQCGGAGDVSFTWSTIVSGVTFDPKYVNKRNIFIKDGTLPGDMTIPITVTVAKVDDPSQNTSRTVIVTTVSSDPVAKIKGSAFQTIGVSSGIVDIDGSRSYDPDGQDDLLMYMWTCRNLFTQGPCLSADSVNILPSDQTNTSSISFDAILMVPETIYEITLTVMKNSRSDTASQIIQAKAGTPPQIIPGEVEPRVRRDKYFYVAAIITHVGDITVVWETTDEGEGFIDMTDLYATQLFVPGYSLTAFIIDKGTLEEGTSYTFQVTATDTQNQVSVSSVSTRVYAGVSSCSFSLLDGATSYTELEELFFVVENCVTDEEALPLNFQLFLERRGRFRAQGEANFEGEFDTLGRGPPAQGSVNHYVAKVCNTFSSCQVFSLYLTVVEKPSFTIDEFQAIKDNQVAEAKNSGNFDSALNIFLAVLETFQRQDGSRRRKRAVPTLPAQTEENAAVLLDLIQSAIESTVLTTVNAQTRIDQSDALIITDLTLADIGILLGIYEDLLEVFFSVEELLPDDSADVVNGKLDDIIGVLTLPDDQSLHDRVGNISQSVSSSRLVGAPPGETIDTVSEYSHQRALNTIPQGTYSSTSNDTTSFEIDFGSDIETSFGPNWECGNIDPCSGVNIIFTQYHDDVNFLPDSLNDTRASAIIDIKLYKPSTDEMLTVSGLTAPISINLTATLLHAGKVYDCYFWDSLESLWSTNGVMTIHHSATESQCLSDHLTSFALFAVDPPTTPMATTADGTSGPTADSTTDTTSATTTTTTAPATTTGTGDPGPAPGLSVTIIAVISVVAVILIVIIIVIVAIVYMKSKKNRENKIRDITPPPNRPEDMAMRP